MIFVVCVGGARGAGPRSRVFAFAEGKRLLP